MNKKYSTQQTNSVFEHNIVSLRVIIPKPLAFEQVFGDGYAPFKKQMLSNSSIFIQVARHSFLRHERENLTLTIVETILIVNNYSPKYICLVNSIISYK